MKLVKIAFILAGLLLISGMTWANTPQIVSYQGRLLDADGDPVTDGNYEMTFSIFDAAVGGVLQWTETQNPVYVSDGLFDVQLGSVESLPDSVFSGEERYLEVSIQGQIITPRTQFTSVAYAERISTIDGATGGDLTGSVTIQPVDYTTSGNSLSILDSNQDTLVQITADLGGITTFSMFDPVDSKATPTPSVKIEVGGSGSTFSMFDPVDSKATPTPSVKIEVGGSGTSMSFFDPVDSKFGLAGDPIPLVQINKEGIFMYDSTGLDTTLQVTNQGNIVGLGQITMGENTSDGVQTIVLGFNNNGTGDSSTIGGGTYNTTLGAISVIDGGFSNTASGEGASIGGGSNNNATGNYATISGGKDNTAMGDYATVPGGNLNAANGASSYTAGHRAKSEFNGSFVWADGTDEDFSSTGDNQFIIRANGGVGIGTNSPSGMLEVDGPSGDGTVNLPESAIASPEILDEPGLSSAQDGIEVFLVQKAASMVDILTTSITVPAAGYIMVTGGGSLKAAGTSAANQVYLQIDETAGGTIISPYYLITGSGDHDSPNKTHYFAINVQRIYQVAAGTYDFRLEGMSSPDNGDGAVTSIVNPYITAVFIPTAYGAITANSQSSSLR